MVLTQQIELQPLNVKIVVSLKLNLVGKIYINEKYSKKYWDNKIFTKNYNENNIYIKKVITINIKHAITKYVLSNLLIVFQYWYKREATTNLATSKAPAIIITSVLAPANRCDKPNTE